MPSLFFRTVTETFPEDELGRPNLALVTGASSGIGRAFAEKLASGGSDLVVVARRLDRLDELAHHLRSRWGVRVEVLAADLSEPEQLATVETRLADAGRPVDLLVNSAGRGSQGPFAALAVADEDQEIRLNVVAPVRLTRAVLPSMIERGAGAVINVSSIAGLQPLPYWATYGATKSYLTSFSVALHEEVRRQGVGVLALMPGFTRTEFHEASGVSESVAPSAIWMTSDHVVDAALRALRRGRATCVPGLGYAAFAAATRFVPWMLARRIVGRVGRRRASS